MLGLTQQQFADQLGVTYQQVHKYEKGVNRISAGRLVQAMAALGTSAGELLDDLIVPRDLPRTTREFMDLAGLFGRLPPNARRPALTMLRVFISYCDGQEAAWQGGIA